MAVWVFSPTAAIGAALHEHVAQLGFAVAKDPERALVVLVDLSSFASPPPAPATPSVALLGTADARTVREAREAGYDRIVLPTEGPEHLRYAIAQLLAVSGDETAPGTAPKEPAHAVEVTPREREVLNLLMLGLTNKRIAKHLDITERTVKFHVAALMRKHGVRTRSALMLKNPIVVTRVGSGTASLRIRDRAAAPEPAASDDRHDPDDLIEPS